MEKKERVVQVSRVNISFKLNKNQDSKRDIHALLTSDERMKRTHPWLACHFNRIMCTIRCQGQRVESLSFKTSCRLHQKENPKDKSYIFLTEVCCRLQMLTEWPQWKSSTELLDSFHDHRHYKWQEWTWQTCIFPLFPFSWESEWLRQMSYCRSHFRCYSNPSTIGKRT